MGTCWCNCCVLIPTDQYQYRDYAIFTQNSPATDIVEHAECVSAGEMDSNQLQTTVLYCRLVVVVLLVSLRRRWSLAGERTRRKPTEESRREMSHMGYVVISVPSGK